jgi:hypothetical protein
VEPQCLQSAAGDQGSLQQHTTSERLADVNLRRALLFATSSKYKSWRHGRAHRRPEPVNGIVQAQLAVFSRQLTTHILTHLDANCVRGRSFPKQPRPNLFQFLTSRPCRAARDRNQTQRSEIVALDPVMVFNHPPNGVADVKALLGYWCPQHPCQPVKNLPSW